jgi:hypothetical protein
MSGEHRTLSLDESSASALPEGQRRVAALREQHRFAKLASRPKGSQRQVSKAPLPGLYAAISMR